ncbi:MAG TPA: SpoIIE family protein phosphatase [Thermoleophilaceae bacterium]|jgi:PAS domain S-box-containing protein
MSPRPPTSVLIVDDKPSNLVALEAVLRPLELNVVSAGSGEEALRRLLDQDYAAILLDVQMPDMDGFETAEYIKGREKTAHIPIIFLTAIDKEQRQVFRGYSVGAVDYIFKPYDPELLRSKVATFVDLYQKSSALRTSEERFRTAFANAPIGIALIETDGSWMQANRALCELVGYSQHELVDRELWELSHPEDQEADRAQLRSLVAGQVGAFHAEKRLVHRDGRTVNVLVSVSLARDAHGSPMNYIVQLVDVTERRRAELEHAERIRHQAALAEAEAVAETIQKIQRVSDAALAHLELEDVMRELVSRFREIMSADCATILLMEPGDECLRVGATAGLSLDVRDLLQPVGEGFTGTIAADATAAAVEELGEGGLESALRKAGAVSALGVPMLVEGRVTGVICVATTAERRFTAEDRSLLQLVAERAALALEHARVYQRELGIVEMLQRSLLPERLPRLPGIQVAARYLPGGGGAEVGGDWYDAIPLEGGRIGLALGDVVGHGIGAASLMGQLRNALRAYAVEGHGPADVVSRLDRLVQGLEQGRMATLLYMVLDADLGSVTFSTAGHLPPLLLEADRSARYLEGVRMPPLGVMPHANHEETRAEVPAGATLILYTDGLVEERGAAIEAGLDDLKRAVTSGPSEPEALCDHILGTLLADRTASDDVAVLVLQTAPMGNRRIELEVTGDSQALGSLRRTLERWLDVAGATAEANHACQVACHEVTSNAIEHGHRFGEVGVQVAAEVDGADVVVTVTDAGHWREPKESDRGRGLALARALMDTVEIEPDPGGTTVRMRRVLNGASPAPERAAAKSAPKRPKAKAARKRPAARSAAKGSD